ncbi:glycosyltransferase family 2 protein [Pseudogemmobacter humi]|uniref:Glycosyl transferase family 2 n=1 Tax=Pseudogemmobacter humi TaxID=2483812 RepID=A0A3P5Y0J4_9RHOB|nr:glycosyltransferase family 2 protein [Pseudogemmobacter humi]VDC33962.1 Glycosyl transferase family 2 [Pseudogemmobacter humi]
MPQPETLTAIIMSLNEEQHITRCIESLRPVAERIVVVDSFSTDRTIEIAQRLGAEVLQNRFVSHAHQYQWALDRLGVTSAWILRVDADEYLETVLQQSILEFLADPGAVNAVFLRRKIVFLGRPILHGFFYPLKILRLYRTGQGRMEQRRMDEHITVDTPVCRTLDGDLVDDNLNCLAWWSSKHIGYARKEAWEIIACRQGGQSAPPLSGAARRKRFLKNRVYNRLPSALRSTLYFFYRYVIGLGFLDGKAGFFFHFLQAYWYRTYVDATLYEIERQAAAEGLSAYQMLRRDGIL